MDLQHFTVHQGHKDLPYTTPYIEGAPWFPYTGDEELPPEDIAIILVTNGWGHFSPTLVVDYNWVNHEKITKFFHCLDAAHSIYTDIDWTVESQETQRE